jgi:hypothetical protein
MTRARQTSSLEAVSFPLFLEPSGAHNPNGRSAETVLLLAIAFHLPLADMAQALASYPQIS